MKYPIGIDDFGKIISEGYAYVDKTDLIYSLVSEGGAFILCRPRCFGKSLLTSTIKNYFLGRRELFKGLKMERLEKEWKSRPVFHIDLCQGSYVQPWDLQQYLELSVARWEELYCVDSNWERSVGDRFVDVLSAAHKHTGQECVVLIDGYDKPLLDAVGKPEKLRENDSMVTLLSHRMSTLRSFFSSLKAARGHIHFVLLTGEVKFTELNSDDGLSHVEDISLSSRYATLCGFTEAEIEKHFHEPIAELAQDSERTYDDVYGELRKRYGGYHFSEVGDAVFSPTSMLNVFDNNDIGTYLFTMGFPAYLRLTHEQYDDSFDMFTSRTFSDLDVSAYQTAGEHPNPLPLIYQGGLLTIRSYDPDKWTYKLDFPNDETRKCVAISLANNYFKATGVIQWTYDLLDALESGDADRVRMEFTAFINRIPSEVWQGKGKVESERHFTYTLYLIFNLVGCYVSYDERQRGYGQLDCLVETSNNVYLFAFRLDGSATDGIADIKAAGIPVTAKNLFKIGVSMSSDDGTVDEWRVE